MKFTSEIETWWSSVTCFYSVTVKVFPFFLFGNNYDSTSPRFENFHVKIIPVSTQTLPSAQSSLNPSRHALWLYLSPLLVFMLALCSFLLVHLLPPASHSIGDKYFHLYICIWPAVPRLLVVLAHGRVHVEWFEHFEGREKTKPGRSYLEKLPGEGDGDHLVDIISCLISMITLLPIF